MANIISGADVFGRSTTYLTAADKARMHNEQTAFYIVDATPEQEGLYGTQTVFDIKAKGMDDARLAFNADANRIAQAKRIIKLLVGDSDAVGPCYLGRWEANGKSGWQITFEPTTVLKIPATQSEQAVTDKAERVAEHDANMTNDDSLPF